MEGNQDHPGPSFCRSRCSPTDDKTKLAMLNSWFHLNLRALPKEEVIATGLKKRIIQAKNLGGAVVRRELARLAGQPVDRTSEQAEILHAICRACPSGRYNAELDECNDCYCRMKKKTCWTTERCQRGHFDARLREFGEDWWFDDLISVIVPARNEPQLVETLDSLIANCSKLEQIEWIVILDGWDTQPVDGKISLDELTRFATVLDDFQSRLVHAHKITVYRYEQNVGQRVGINEAVKAAKGKYIFKIDAHCRITPGWDQHFRDQTDEQTILIPPIQSTSSGHIQDYFYIRSNYSNTWWEGYQPNIQRESMSLSGGAWFCEKSFYEYFGGHLESLGPWGNCGSEMALKCWLSGGRIISVPDVIVEHEYKKPFRYRPTGIKLHSGRKELKYLVENKKLKNQILSIKWLVNKFSPVPTWE